MAKEHYSPEVITARLKGKRWEDHREYLANYNKYEERGFTVIEYDVMERQGDYAAASVGSANIFHKLVRHDKKYIDSNDNEIREVEAQKLRNQYIAEQQKAKEAEERKQQEANKQKAKEEQEGMLRLRATPFRSTKGMPLSIPPPNGPPRITNKPHERMPLSIPHQTDRVEG
ncbi:MAG: hypothetical protein ACE1S7_08185, partial [Candidatus Tisiphia sp.]